MADPGLSKSGGGVNKTIEEIAARSVFEGPFAPTYEELYTSLAAIDEVLFREALHNAWLMRQKGADPGDAYMDAYLHAREGILRGLSAGQTEREVRALTSESISALMKPVVNEVVVIPPEAA